jgi:RHS repeat-associated protein
VKDPDTGTRGFEYNGWNELFARVDATGARTEFHRDALGRVFSEQRPDGTTDYVWDTAAFGIGRLHRASSPDGVETEERYNSAGQRTAIIRRVDGRTFQTSFGYDPSGRLTDVTYPTGGLPLRTRYEYSRGFLARVLRTDTATPSTLWEATVRDAHGRATTERFSALVAPTFTSRTYDPVTNRVASLVTTTTPPTGVPTRVQDLRFTYTRHALARITDLLSGRTDQYIQDAFDRLARWEPTDGPPQDYTYDALDNLTRLGSRTLTYGDPNKPHTPTAIGGLAVTHDPNGRRITASGFNATYTHFDLPRTINGTAFRYDPFQERAVKTSAGTTTYYAGGHYELSLSSTGVATHTYRVLAEGRAVTEITHKPSTGETKVFNLHDSAVGHTETITDSAGFVAARYRYEPFGRRTAVPASYYGSRRGFTGHEHDDELGLINMRGRMYDPSSGRFLTPDPIAAGIGRGIGWNRYAYVQNNPLNARDPSGFQMCDGDAPGCAGGDLDGDGTVGAGIGPPDTAPWTPGPVGPEDAAWSMLPQGFAEAFAQAMCRTEECMDAEVARTPIGRLITAMRDFMDRLAEFAAVVGTVASGFVPGLGELMDVYVLLTSSDDAELRAAGFSLGVSIGTMIAGFEFAPNYASIRLADDILEAGGGRMMRATFLNRGDPRGGSFAGIVSQSSDGFRLANGDPPDAGTYDFVLQNGQLRIGGGHYHLSGGQPVEYAGTITFGANGALLEWTNASGHFLPSAAFARNAGLPLDAFRPVWIPAMVGNPQLPVFRDP